jgi:cytochrome c
MFKSYHKKIISSALVASVVLLGTACNASSESDKHAVKEAPVKTEAKAPVEAEKKVEKKTEAKAEVKTTSNPSVGPAKPTLSDSVKDTYAFNGKKIVDGGVTYPIVNGMTGAYHVNESAHTAHSQYGKIATANEQKAWDIDVMPDGTGLPEGSGSVEDGDELYEEKCGSCHGDFGSGSGSYPKLTAGNAYEMQKTMLKQRINGNDEGPQRTFGSYWPQASTFWWYVKTGMPHPAPLSLSDDEVYAITAYILSVNEIEIDGEELEDEYVLDRAKFLKIVMPNKDGFIPVIDGPNGQENVRAFFNDVNNYGNGTRCMKNCFEGKPVVQKIATPIQDFAPPLSNVKDLPAPKADAKPAHPGKAGYDKACAICHATDGMGAPDVGNKKVWAKVLEKGLDKVYANGINGINGMPPKGGTSLDDAAFKEIVDYMIEESK